ncbi:MAG: PAS domain S-box protein [bacterium]|nr:PAS domain S-box protein [bacterium]
MSKESKTKKQLLEEEARLRQRIAEMEILEAEHRIIEDELRQSKRELSIRNEIISIFLTTPDDEMYAKVLRVILKHTESQYGLFGYIDQEGNLVCPSLTRDIWDQCQVPHKNFIFPREQWGGLWGQSLKEKKTLCSNKPLPVPEGHVPILKTLIVPIIHGTKLIGLLAVANKAEDYTPQDQTMLETIADHIAPVLHARLQRDRQEAERQRSEEKLRESEAKYSALVEQAKDGVVIVQDEVLKFANKAMETLSGYSVEELIGKSCFDIVAPEHRDFVAQRHRLRLQGLPVPASYEIKLLDKNGAKKEVEVSVGLINYQGKPAITAFIRDISERKRMEEELLKVQKLESLGILAGGIAHDFNNLLAVTIGNLSLLELEISGYGDTASELLEAIKTASYQAKRLTQQLLTFARGGAPIRKVASVSNLLKDAVNFALSGSRVKCELIIPDDLWPAEIDEGQISQAIDNIIINAEQAMPAGGLIRVWAENVTVEPNLSLPLKRGEYVKISIQDQGVGIPEENLPKIFDPYFTTKQKGAGLGLSIAYSIIKKHCGYIGVESELGVGSVFHIYLPATRQEISTAPSGGVSEEKFCCGWGKILLMDDQEMIRNMARQMLTRLGYRVEFASHGEEAIRLFRQAKESKDPFCAVILDLTIPGGMGGKETIQKLREIDPEVRAIASSGYSNDPIMTEYQKYGFKGIVSKPYEIKELSEVLQRVIMGNEGPAQTFG